MQRVSAKFAVNTPLFGGGANPEVSAEFRPPSIKGVLRFWWRALAWSRCGGDLDDIRSKETAIFGSAGGDQKGGQACFLLRATAMPQPQIVKPLEVLNGSDGKVVGVGARYFGYGLMEAFGASAGKTTRSCLKAPFEFTVELISRKPVDRSLIDALKLMGLLGGLGRRSRRGWGSLTLLSLKDGDREIWQVPTDRESYRSALLDVIGKPRLHEREPEYSAFWKKTRIEIVDQDNDPLRLLNRVGEEMLRYRSWGRPDKFGVNKVGNVKVDRNFADDHDWFKAGEHGSALAAGRPRRAVFGLPHNYSQKFHVTAKSFERRASPLFIHIHRLTDQKQIAVLAVLRSAFLPPGESLKVSNGHAESHPEAAADWGVFDDFIDGIKGKPPYFPSRTPVLP